MFGERERAWYRGLEGLCLIYFAPIIADDAGRSVQIVLTCKYVFQENAEDNMQKDVLFHHCLGLLSPYGWVAISRQGKK